MSCPPLVDELLVVVRELASVRPHEAGDSRLSHAEWSVYCRGYYMALCSALAVMDAALRRHTLRARARRELEHQVGDRARPRAGATARSATRPAPVGVSAGDPRAWRSSAGRGALSRANRRKSLLIRRLH